MTTNWRGVSGGRFADGTTRRVPLETGVPTMRSRPLDRRAVITARAAVAAPAPARAVDTTTVARLLRGHRPTSSIPPDRPAGSAFVDDDVWHRFTVPYLEGESLEDCRLGC